MNYSIILLLFFIELFGFVAITQGIDYCSRSLCRGKKHIGCGNSGGFSSTCSPDRKQISMTPQLIKSILTRHNEHRNTVASGKLSGYKSSPRMATLMWDNELASLAAMTARTCKFEHDQCHNTKRYQYSGQNLAVKWSSAPFANSVSTKIVQMVDSWWAEYKVGSMKSINHYPSHPRAMIGHFTVMSVEDNNAMGCAATSYRDRNMKNYYTILLVCNYGKTNMIGDRIYEEGRATSKCSTGTNPVFRALCSVSELYS